MGLADWLRRQFSFEEPDRAQQVDALARTVFTALTADVRDFRLDEVLSATTYEKEDLAPALEGAYRLLLNQLWEDGRLDRGERDLAYVAAGRLEISDARAEELNARLAKSRFGAALAGALEDGVIDADELALLRHIADSCGSTVEEFARDFFRLEGQAILRKLFLTSIADGTLSAQEWERLLCASELLGLKRSSFLESVQIHAERFVDQVLAEVKARGRLTDAEDASLEWLLRTLPLSSQRRQQVETELSRMRDARDRARFRATLEEAFEGGAVNDHAIARLRHIAESRGSTTAAFAGEFFRAEGQAILQRLFLTSIADGVLSTQEWDRLLAVAELLGQKQAALMESFQVHADGFIEQVLTEVKADGRFTDAEEQTLDWLRRTLPLSKERRQYVEAEVSRLRDFRDFERGKLPHVPPPAGLGLRAAEVVHFSRQGEWQAVRKLKAGDTTDSHHGQVVITDSRLLFASASRSQSVAFRTVVAHRLRSWGFEIQVSGKPAATVVLGPASERGYRIFASAAAMANQTLVVKADGLPIRHIARDVRQRVYQQYGGRCAECHARDYLEYDHIIPFSKGGGNSEANVQLLCRRCNLKKSDAI